MLGVSCCSPSSDCRVLCQEPVFAVLALAVGYCTRGSVVEALALELRTWEGHLMRLRGGGSSETRTRFQDGMPVAFWLCPQMHISYVIYVSNAHKLWPRALITSLQDTLDSKVLF